MARKAVIERDELIETANRMAAEGKQVTALSLLEALGGGSLTTIYKYLAEWEAARPKTAPASGGAEVPDNVQNAFMQTWRVATMEAARETQAAKEKAAEEVKAAQGKFEGALEGIQKLEAQAEQDTAQIEELKARVAELEQSVSQLSNDNAASRATAEQLRHQVKSQQTELDRLHKDFEQDRQAHREQMEKLNADHASAQNKASEQIERLHMDLTEALKKLEQSERDRLEAKIKLEQSQQQAQAAEQNRELANKEREASGKEAAALKGQVEALTAQNSQLLATLASQAQEKRKGKTD